MTGYGVEPEVLGGFAGALDGMAADVREVAGRIGAANSLNADAFGILLGQVLAVPTRVALGVVQSKVDLAAEGVSDDAAHLRGTQENYGTTEGTNARSLARRVQQ